MRAIILYPLMMIIVFTSCKNNTEKINKLNGELQGITDTLNLCLNERNNAISQIDTLHDYIQQVASEIYQDSTDLAEYFSNHKMAVLCIDGGYVSAKVKTDFDKDYPQTVENLATWGVAIAMTYYVFNQEEVDSVIEESETSHNKKNQLYAQIESYKQNIAQDDNYLATVATVETTCQNRALMLRQEIEALK